MSTAIRMNLKQQDLLKSYLDNLDYLNSSICRVAKINRYHSERERG